MNISLYPSDLIEAPKDAEPCSMRGINEEAPERMTIENIMVEEEGDDKSKIVLRISVSSTLGKFIVLIHLMLSIISSYQSTIVIGLGLVYSSSIYYQLIQTNDKLLQDEFQFLSSRLENLNGVRDNLNNEITLLNESIHLLESQLDNMS